MLDQLGLDVVANNLFNVSPQVLFALVTWELLWKSIALWKAARKNHMYWFVALILLNTAGILPILYILFFSKKSGK